MGGCLSSHVGAVHASKQVSSSEDAGRRKELFTALDLVSGPVGPPVKPVNSAECGAAVPPSCSHAHTLMCVVASRHAGLRGSSGPQPSLATSEALYEQYARAAAAGRATVADSVAVHSVLDLHAAVLASQTQRKWLATLPFCSDAAITLEGLKAAMLTGSDPQLAIHLPRSSTDAVEAHGLSLPALWHACHLWLQLRCARDHPHSVTPFGSIPNASAVAAKAVARLEAWLQLKCARTVASAATIQPVGRTAHMSNNASKRVEESRAHSDDVSADGLGTDCAYAFEEEVAAAAESCGLTPACVIEHVGVRALCDHVFLHFEDVPFQELLAAMKDALERALASGDADALPLIGDAAATLALLDNAACVAALRRHLIGATRPPRAGFCPPSTLSAEANSALQRAHDAACAAMREGERDDERVFVGAVARAFPPTMTVQACLHAIVLSSQPASSKLAVDTDACVDDHGGIGHLTSGQISAERDAAGSFFSIDDVAVAAAAGAASADRGRLLAAHGGVPHAACMVGRQAEVARVLQQLRAGRRFTFLWGVLGVGKSCVAGAAAASMLQTGDWCGVRHVDLTTAHTAEAAIVAVANSLHCPLPVRAVDGDGRLAAFHVAHALTCCGGSMEDAPEGGPALRVGLFLDDVDALMGGEDAAAFDAWLQLVLNFSSGVQVLATCRTVPANIVARPDVALAPIAALSEEDSLAVLSAGCAAAAARRACSDSPSTGSSETIDPGVTHRLGLLLPPCARACGGNPLLLTLMQPHLLRCAESSVDAFRLQKTLHALCADTPAGALGDSISVTQRLCLLFDATAVVPPVLAAAVAAAAHVPEDVPLRLRATLLSQAFRGLPAHAVMRLLAELNLLRVRADATALDAASLREVLPACGLRSVVQEAVESGQLAGAGGTWDVGSTPQGAASPVDAVFSHWAAAAELRNSGNRRAALLAMTQLHGAIAHAIASLQPHRRLSPSEAAWLYTCVTAGGVELLRESQARALAAALRAAMPAHGPPHASPETRVMLQIAATQLQVALGMSHDALADSAALLPRCAAGVHPEVLFRACCLRGDVLAAGAHGDARRLGVAVKLFECAADYLEQAGRCDAAPERGSGGARSTPRAVRRPSEHGVLAAAAACSAVLREGASPMEGGALTLLVSLASLRSASAAGAAGLRARLLLSLARAQVAVGDARSAEALARRGLAVCSAHADSRAPSPSPEAPPPPTAGCAQLVTMRPGAVDTFLAAHALAQQLAAKRGALTAHGSDAEQHAMLAALFSLTCPAYRAAFVAGAAVGGDPQDGLRAMMCSAAASGDAAAADALARLKDVQGVGGTLGGHVAVIAAAAMSRAHAADDEAVATVLESACQTVGPSAPGCGIAMREWAASCRMRQSGLWRTLACALLPAATPRLWRHASGSAAQDATPHLPCPNRAPQALANETDSATAAGRGSLAPHHVSAEHGSAEGAPFFDPHGIASDYGSCRSLASDETFASFCDAASVLMSVGGLSTRGSEVGDDVLRSTALCSGPFSGSCFPSLALEECLPELLASAVDGGRDVRGDGGAIDTQADGEHDLVRAPSAQDFDLWTVPPSLPAHAPDRAVPAGAAEPPADGAVIGEPLAEPLPGCWDAQLDDSQRSGQSSIELRAPPSPLLEILPPLTASRSIVAGRARDSGTLAAAVSGALTAAADAAQDWAPPPVWGVERRTELGGVRRHSAPLDARASDPGRVSAAASLSSTALMFADSGQWELRTTAGSVPSLNGFDDSVTLQPRTLRELYDVRTSAASTSSGGLRRPRVGRELLELDGAADLSGHALAPSDALDGPAAAQDAAAGQQQSADAAAEPCDSIGLGEGDAGAASKLSRLSQNARARSSPDKMSHISLDEFETRSGSSPLSAVIGVHPEPFSHTWYANALAMSSALTSPVAATSPDKDTCNSVAWEQSFAAEDRSLP